MVMQECRAWRGSARFAMSRIGNSRSVAMDKSGAAVDQNASRTAIHRERLGFYRDASTFLRDILIGGLILFCVMRPDVVRSWLSALGVSKATFLGFELTPGNERELAATIDGLRQQRDAAIFERNSLAEKAAAALRELEQLKGSDPALRGEIASIEASTRPTQPPAGSQARKIQNELIEGAQRTLGSAEGWGVIFGGDVSLEAAQTEVDWARRNGLNNVGIVRRQGSFRSIVFVARSAEAAEQVRRLVSRRRPDSYVVNLASWCPNLVERNGYRECG